jgi:hypothetical protein
MDNAKGIVQIVFLGHFRQVERIKYLLRRFIPHKVYFIRSMESTNVPDGMTEEYRNEMKREFEKELPRWVVENSEEIRMPYFDFGAIFPQLTKIMAEERAKGNEVIVNIHSASIMMAMAAVVAAALTDAKVYWVQPEKWVVDKVARDKSLQPVGATDAYEIKMPLVPGLPKSPDKDVLKYIFSKGGKTKSKLATMSEEIGLKSLGANVKKPGSGIVKLSKIIKRLREDGHITTKKVGRKNFEVELTDKGKMVAEVVSLI